jgi:3-deoxy-7-phosphoheptulonate synthase
MSNTPSYKLASRAYKSDNTVISTQKNSVGAEDLLLISGPCAVESEEQIHTIASRLSNLGVKMLRGGAYKPRTSPYNFQGLGKTGLKLLNDCKTAYGIEIITEVMGLSLLDEVYPYTDIIQVGARNMKNYAFLKELGKTDKPILLKRGMDATVEEWLLAAEYILLGGNEEVILCERGIRTFDSSTRNTFDVAAIPLVKQLSHLPVIADPSQATGNRDLIGATTLAALAAGADGIMLEVHNEPEKALSDGPQSLTLEQFASWLPKFKNMANYMGKNLQLSHKMEFTNL